MNSDTESNILFSALKALKIKIKSKSSMMKAADVNDDGEVNAIDASLVLAYYAHISAGGTLSLKDFISDKV